MEAVPVLLTHNKLVLYGIYRISKVSLLLRCISDFPSTYSCIDFECFVPSKGRQHLRSDNEDAMCNGETGRASNGGTIAILKPSATTSRPPIRRELSLRLATDISNGQTIATFGGLDEGHADSHVVIQ